MAFEYPKMAFSSKISPSDTKKFKINIKNQFCNYLAFKAQKNYELAFLAFIEVKMWFQVIFESSQPILSKIYGQTVFGWNLPKPAIVTSCQLETHKNNDWLRGPISPFY